MSTDSAVRENLTRREAAARAEQIGAVTTRVVLDLTAGEETFHSDTEVAFEMVAGGPTFVDCTAATVHEVVLDGQPLPLDVVEPTRIVLPDLAPGPHTLQVRATMNYQREGAGLHRFVDPSDGRVYLHSQFEPFDAHLVYACFDQPDLKTVFELTVQAPADWVVVSNSDATEHPSPGAAGRWVFAPTPAVSTYITAVVAGAYTSVHDRYVREDASSIPLGIYVRRSLADHLDAEEIFTVTRQSFAALESLFGQNYPFAGSYDQLFVPEFSAGAMENPGCVTLSESYVFRSRVTDAIRERRAETIIHEMAHMWFGDLVTMRWWDDLWLNESFATFMSVHVQANSTRWTNAWTTFLDAEKAWAKYQDQLPSTHPIADAMPDVESVHQNFDGITYAKGAAVLRQLVAWVGEDAFFAGCRDYFGRYAWGNTTLVDFLRALERASGRDLSGWSDEWLRTTGVNDLSIDAEVGADGTYTSVSVIQQSPAPSWAEQVDVEVVGGVLRRHRLAVGLYRRSNDGIVRDQRIELDVTGERTEVPDLVGVRAADLLLVNDDDLTYAKVRLDPASAAVATAELAQVTDPLARAQIWGAMWDMLRDGALPARRFVELVISNVEVEQEIGALQRLLSRANAAARRYADPAGRHDLLTRLALHARTAADRAPAASDHQLAWVRHWASVAAAVPGQLRDLAALLDGAPTFAELTVDAELRWHLLTCLAQAGIRADADIDTELGKDPTDLGERHAASARAIQPTPAAKAAAWERLLQDRTMSHTLSRQVWHGFMQLDQAEVLAPYVDRYFDALDHVWRERSLDWAIGFTSATFPHAVASPALLGRLDALLADGDLPGPLRRVLLEERDVLVRTLQARELDAAAATADA